MRAAPAEGARGHLLPGRLGEDKSPGPLSSPHLTTATRSPHSVTPGTRLALPALAPRGALCLGDGPSGVAAALSPRPFVTCLVQSETFVLQGVGLQDRKILSGGPWLFLQISCHPPSGSSSPMGGEQGPCPLWGAAAPRGALGAWKGVMVLSWIMQWENDAFWYTC